MKYLRYLSFALLFMFVLTMLIHTSTAFDQDLGRHIKLGEIIWQMKSVPKTNLFSYTYPSFPFVNHHWLPEVVFFLLNRSFEVESISYLKIVSIFLAILVTFLTSRKVSSTQIAVVCLTILTPLLMNRSDERPEIFGLLFFSSYLFLYFSHRVKKKPFLIVYLIPFVQLIWANSHITFIYGLFLLLVFVLDQLLFLKNGQEARPWIVVLIASIFASIANPHGLTGFLYPFHILTNYGYSIQENQNLFFLRSLTTNIFITLFWYQSIVVILFSAISFWFDIQRKQLIRHAIYYGLFLVFFISSILLIRNFPFFVLMSAISFSYFLARSREALSIYIKKYSLLIPFILIATCAVLLALSGCEEYPDYNFELRRTDPPSFIFSGRSAGACFVR